MQMADESHSHFTDTLQEALDMLKKKMYKPAKSTEDVVATNAVEATSNMFSKLDVHDCLELDDSVESSNAPKQNGLTSTNTPRRAKQPSDVVVAEDVFMRIICFFTDLQAIRYQVIEMWVYYTMGKNTLMGVAMTTNAAIALVDHMEKELLEVLLPEGSSPVEASIPFGGVCSTYSTLMGMMLRLHSSDGEPQYLDPVNVFLPANHFWLFDMGLILSKISYGLMQRKKHGHTAFDYAKTLEKRQSGNDTPMPILWPRVETMEMIFLTKSMFADMVHAEGFKKLKENDEFVTAIVLDSFLSSEFMYSNPNHRMHAACLDEATKAFLKLDEGKIGAAALLSSVIIMDLDEVFKVQRNDVYSQLSAHAQNCFDLVKHAQPQYQKLGFTGPLWGITDIAHAKSIDLLDCYIHDRGGKWAQWQKFINKQSPANHLNIALEKHVKWADGLAMEYLPILDGERKMRLKKLTDEYTHHYMLAHIDPSLFLSRNPIASGTAMYQQAIRREQAGIGLANSHLSIFCVAYVYKALKARRILDGRWADMETLIDTHVRSIFLGSKPTTPDSIEKLWQLRTQRGQGKTKTLEGLGGDRTGRRPVREARSSCLSISESSVLLADWMDGGETFIRMIYAMNKLMLKESSESRAKSHQQPILNPFEFLSPFTDFLAAEAERFKIDYITVTRQCNGLLQALAESQLVSFDLWASAQPDIYHDGADIQEIVERKLNCKPHAWLMLVNALLTQDAIFSQGPGPHLKELGLTKNDLPAIDKMSPIFEVAKFVQKYMDKQGMLTRKDGKISTAQGPSSRATDRQPTAEEVLDEEFSASMAGMGDLSLM